MAACATISPTGGLDGFETGSATVGDQELTVALAETSGQRAQGLMNVKRLPDGLDGMLFVYEDAFTASYHMENTLIPLDIWWFGADGLLLGSTEMEPCTDPICPSHPSPGPIMWALETPQGEYSFALGARLSSG